jgi:hypothetical protein
MHKKSQHAIWIKHRENPDREKGEANPHRGKNMEELARASAPHVTCADSIAAGQCPFHLLVPGRANPEQRRMAGTSRMEPHHGVVSTVGSLAA